MSDDEPVVVPSWDPLISAMIARQVARRAEALEEVFEESLTDSQGRGVLVVRYPTRDELRLDARVPWGTIYVFILTPDQSFDDIPTELPNTSTDFRRPEW